MKNVNLNPRSSMMQESIEFPDVKIDDVNVAVGKPKVVTEIVRGRVVNKVVFEVEDLEKRDEGLHVDDFALENLLAAGYEKKRFDVENGGFAAVDSAVKGAEALSKAHVRIKKTEVESIKNE